MFIGLNLGLSPMFNRMMVSAGAGMLMGSGLGAVTIARARAIVGY